MKTPIRVTQQQRDNALEALHVMWPSVPPRNVVPDLSWWRRKGGRDVRDPAPPPPTCNTLACFGGWCAWWPAFQAQGVVPGHAGAPRLTRHDRYVRGAVSQMLFGTEWIFCARANTDIEEIDEREGCMTDHEAVTERLRWLIEHSEVTP